MNYERIEAFDELYLPSEERNDGSQIPAGWWIETPIGKILKSTTNLFLQQFVDRGYVVFIKLEELTLSVGHTTLWIRLYDDHVVLEYMATQHDKRGNGSGTRAMTVLTEIADTTNTRLELTTDVVLVIKSPLPTHPTVVEGTKGEKRIPAHQLVDWFEGFEFVKGNRTEDMEFDEPGYHMRREPNSIQGK